MVRFIHGVPEGTTTLLGGKQFFDRITSSMQIAKDCSKSDGTSSNNCFPKQTTMHGWRIHTPVNYFGPTAMAVLSNGASVAIGMSWPKCIGSAGSLNGNVCGSIIVDVDGPSGKNEFGRDMFEFYITKKGIFVSTNGSKNSYYSNACFNGEPVSSRQCAGWVIETGNMDYLQADETGKCPNGKQLSWDSPRCNQ